MDAVTVEVAAGAVIVLGGSRIGVSREDLGVAERDPGVEGVRDCRMSQRVRADVTGDSIPVRSTRAR